MLIAFDFDGTLVDSMCGLEDLAVELVCPAFDLTETVVRQHYRATAGDPFVDQLARLAPGQRLLVEQTAVRFEQKKRAVTLEAEPFTDVHRALIALNRGHHTLDIISSTKTDLIRTWLELHNLDQYIEAYWGLDYGSKLEQLQRCDPDLFIGDSYLDKVRADANQTKFWGLSRNERLLSRSLAGGTTLLELVMELG